jgi:ATP-binding cassette subfamily F protein 3
MTGLETPDEGSAALIGQNVVMSYFEQNQADALDLNKTVIETIQGASRGQSYNELRALLGQFLFKGDSVEKKVGYLSGGEKARLSLCCMMLKPANLLILASCFCTSCMFLFPRTSSLTLLLFSSQICMFKGSRVLST